MRASSASLVLLVRGESKRIADKIDERWATETANAT